MTYVTHFFLIKGKVQKAGFRARIKDIAKAQGLIGFVKNLQNFDEDVLVMCEGNENRISNFSEDIKKLKSEQEEIIRERKTLKDALSRLNEDLSREYEKLLSKPEDHPENILMLLERKKSLLREIKFYESKATPHFIKEIRPEKDEGKYKEEITKARNNRNFLIIRDENELSDRLYEGIEALVDLRHNTSNLNHDIIDIDFSILNIKYGALTRSISSGFENFPKEFAKAFDTILDKKYGIKPKPKKRT